MVTSARLYELIDQLPERELPAAAQFLEHLHHARDAGPLMRLLDEAPEDDEPLIPEEIAAIEEGVAEHQRGETRPWEEVRAELADE